MTATFLARVSNWHRLQVAPLPARLPRRLSYLLGGLLLVGLALALAYLPLKLAAAAVVLPIGLLLLLLHPTWGLLALIPLIPFSSLISFRLAGVQVGAMEAVLALTIAAWLLRMAARRSIVVPRAPLMLAWGIWMAAVFLSWLVALSIGSAAAETIKWIEMLAVYLFVVANLNRRMLPLVLAVTIASGVIQAAIGLYQYYWGVGPQGFLLMEGNLLRAYGTFRQPNPYAGYLGLTLPLAYSLALHYAGRLRLALGLRRRSEDGPRTVSWRPLLALVATAAATAVIVAGIYASQSRGAWIGMVAAVVVVTAIRSRRAMILFASLAVVAAVLFALGATDLLPASITQRFAGVLPTLQIPNIATTEVTDANFPVIERLAHWQAALDMWRDHLWLGVGFGNYAPVYPAYAIGRWLDPLGHAHNFYLNVAAETGLLGLLAYLAFWLFAFRLGLLSIRANRQFLRAAAVGAVGVLVYFCLHNVVDNLYVQGMYLQVALTLGILAILHRKVDKGRYGD